MGERIEHKNGSISQTPSKNLKFQWISLIISLNVRLDWRVWILLRQRKVHTCASRIKTAVINRETMTKLEH